MKYKQLFESDKKIEPTKEDPFKLRGSIREKKEIIYIRADKDDYDKIREFFNLKSNTKTIDSRDLLEILEKIKETNE